MLVVTIAMTVALVLSAWWWLVGVPAFYVANGHILIDFTEIDVLCKDGIRDKWIRYDDSRIPATGWYSLPDVELVGSVSAGRRSREVIVDIPAWLIVMPMTVFTIVAFRFGRHIKTSEGYCNRCGYNLRGLEPRVRCPECGNLC